MRFLILGSAVLAAQSCFTFASAQVDAAAPGFQLGASPRAVGLFDAYATLASGERVSFDGLNVDLVSEDGTVHSPIASFTSFVFPSFVVIDPSETFALVAESSTGGIYRVDLSSGSLNFVVDIDFAYDLVFGGPDDVLVSAKPGASAENPAETEAGKATELPREIANTGGFHRILVDAPCTASGTLRRNADVRYRLMAEDPEKFAATQLKILSAAQQHLRAKGKLVYATCSVFKTENEDVVAKFLASHPQYKLLEAKCSGSPQIDSDTMFFAVLERR